MQGFLFSRPVPAEQFEQLLRLQQLAADPASTRPRAALIAS
jgi:hypothetical protein